MLEILEEQVGKWLVLIIQMCREVPKFQKICWKPNEIKETAEGKTAYKACPNRNSWKIDENTKMGLSDLKSD